MKKFALKTLLSLLAAFMLTACFSDNPSGTGNPDTGEARLAEGDKLYREQNFFEAMVAYEAAIAADSTLSQAYYGYSRAVLQAYEVRGTELLAELQAASETGNFGVFLEHSDTVLSRRIQALGMVTRVLARLVDRDTLTAWYRYHKGVSAQDSTQDPRFGGRKAFIAHYLDTTSALSRQPSRFPLMDGKVTYAKIGVEFTILLIHYQILDFHDLAPKGVFNVQDRRMNELLTHGNGLGDLMVGNPGDTLLQESVNSQILDLQNGLGDIQQLLEYLQPADSGVSAEASGNIDSVIAFLGETMTFYQFGDHRDNDGDGCVDEEIVDSLDNDLDGFVDEDARTANGDGVDNDRNGSVDDALENKMGSLIPGNPRPYLLTFVGMYLNNQGESNVPEAQATWVKIKKGSLNLSARIAVQRDSLDLKTNAQLTGSHKAKLDSAKTLIGGCWRNYP